MNQAEHRSFGAVRARRLDAMSDAERAEFDEAYVSMRYKIESDERSSGD